MNPRGDVDGPWRSSTTSSLPPPHLGIGCAPDRRQPFIGMDLVEVSPVLDHADITALLGAHLLFESLALLRTRRR
jgi:hypothetical protein